jgi:MarR family transcriptional regulator, transcriptional regulator for hemolysin
MGQVERKAPPQAAGGDEGAGFDPLGRQLSVAARATRSLLDAVLAEAGTTFAAWTVLAALNARGPVIQRDLARSLDMIGPSIVERIDQLEQAGLVTRSAVAEDRRASRVSLTSEGQALFERLHGVMQATEAALTDGIDPRDLVLARAVLAQIADRARALRAQQGARAGRTAAGS